ncbi:hypothetical protein Landi51_05387 [Colletotrichum acutatum]
MGDTHRKTQDSTVNFVRIIQIRRSQTAVSRKALLRYCQSAYTTVASGQSGDIESRGHGTLIDTNRTAADEPPAAPANVSLPRRD